VLSKTKRILLTPLTYVPVGEAYRFATDVLRFTQHILRRIEIIYCRSGVLAAIRAGERRSYRM
jgi:hypothetical protein